MKKGMIAALILLTAFFLVVLLYAVSNAGNIFSGSVSESSPGLEDASSGLNTSTDFFIEEDNLKNDTAVSPPQDTEEGRFFPAITETALGYGDYVLYDEDEMEIHSTGDERNDISLSVGKTRLMDRMYLKDLYSGYEYEIMPPDGFKFLLVSVTAASLADYLEKHTTPATGNFTVVDPSGNLSPRFNLDEDLGAIIKDEVAWDTMVNGRFVIRGVGEIYVGKDVFSSLNAAAGSGPLKGWLIYDVPEDFKVSSDTYLELELGGEKIYWRLHDIQVDLRVKKNYDSGRITISYNGGPESYFVHAIEAEMIKTDGSIEKKFVEADADEEYLPETEFFFSGTPGEQDRLIVKVISSDGKEYVKYLDMI